MSKHVEMFRHGDVALVRIDTAPERTLDKTAKQLVLAEGEVTGHAHVLEGDLTFDRATEPTFVKVRGKATLTHQEHKTLDIPEGTYRIVRQREAWGGEERQVAD